MCACALSVGRAAVVGHVLQAAQQSRVVVRTDPLWGLFLLQGHAALPGGSLSGPDHTVDLLQTLWGHRSQDRGQSSMALIYNEVCVQILLSQWIETVVIPPQFIVFNYIFKIKPTRFDYRVTVQIPLDQTVYSVYCKGAQCVRVLRWGGCCRCSKKSCLWGWSVRGPSWSCEVRCKWSVCWTEASDVETRSSGWGMDTEGGTPPARTQLNETIILTFLYVNYRNMAGSVFTWRLTQTFSFSLLPLLGIPPFPSVTDFLSHVVKISLIYDVTVSGPLSLCLHSSSQSGFSECSLSVYSF